MRKILVIRRKGKLKMKSRSILQLHYKTKEKQIIKEYPIRDLEALLVIGSNIYVESSVFSILSSYNIPVSVVAKDTIGILYNPIVVVNPHYRKLQYSIDKIEGLEIALRYIIARITGMKNILIYHRRDPPPIPNPPENTRDPQSFEYEIRVWESQSANILWDSIIGLIKEPILSELKTKYGFQGRKPKHPDPFNKTLSIMYAVLYSLATKALLASGLDPTYGFLHRTRYNTPLSFDYTEMFKPIAIQATIDLINNQGLPEIGDDGELTREWINKAIVKLYDYLTLHHKDTRKTPYQQIHLKAFCLAKYLDGTCRKDRLTVVWSRALYRNISSTARTPTLKNSKTKSRPLTL